MNEPRLEPIICSRIEEFIPSDLARIIAGYAYQPAIEYLHDLLCSTSDGILLNHETFSKSKWTLHLCESGQLIRTTLCYISPGGICKILYSDKSSYWSIAYFARYGGSDLSRCIQRHTGQCIADYFEISLKRMIDTRILGNLSTLEKKFA